MKDLQAQIAELTANAELQNRAEKQLPNFKLTTFFFNYNERGTTTHIGVNLEKSELALLPNLIQQVLTAFTPTKPNTLTFAGKDNQPTASAFVLRFKNGVRECTAQIDYCSGTDWVSIDLPIQFYKEVYKRGTRSVSDSELHYFGGTSMKEIQKMSLPQYSLNRFDCVKYYGGDTANFIKVTEDKADFEKVVLTGKD